MSNQSCVDEVIYDPEYFPSTFLADKTNPLTPDNLQLSDFFIDRLRNSEIPMKFDTELFTQLLSEIFSSNIDSLLKVRTALLVMICKNYINISDIFNVLLTFDKLDSKVARDGGGAIFIDEGNTIFNDIFFTQLSKNRMLILDTVDSLHAFMDNQEKLQFEELYHIMYKIIRTNENCDTPLPSSKLNFDFIFSYKDKMGQDEYDAFVARIKEEYPILLPLSSRVEEYQKQIKPTNDISIRIKVDRENPLDAVYHFKEYLDIFDEYKLYIEINGEDAIDCGGVTKEFIELVSNELVKPENDLFVLKNNFYWFKYHKNVDADLLKKYECIGIFLGYLIKNGHQINFHFPRYFYKKLLHRPISPTELILYDPELFKGIMKIYESTITEDMYVDYIYQDATCEIDLTNFKDFTGNNDYLPTALTDANKGPFLQDTATWVFDKSIKKIWTAFETGFYSVNINPKMFAQYFKLDELDILISGEREIDWSPLPDCTVYYDCNRNDEIIQWFWKFFMQLDSHKKIDALKFVTGKSTVPIGGFSNGFWKIKRIQYNQSTSMIAAHTCFNTLDLPNYPSYDELANKCELGFASCEGFGFA